MIELINRYVIWSENSIKSAKKSTTAATQPLLQDHSCELETKKCHNLS